MATEAAGLEFRVASEAWEFEAIHGLNHQAFAEEIGQRADSPSRRLVDAFDEENLYLTAIRSRELLGMAALRARRPFSLDLKLPGLDSWLPPASRPAEVRLLAVRPEHRRGRVLPGLLRFLSQHCERAEHDLILISAFVPRLSLYQSLGFEPFGPRVGSSTVPFQPMFLTPPRFEDAARRLHRLAGRAARVAPEAASL